MVDVLYLQLALAPRGSLALHSNLALGQGPELRGPGLALLRCGEGKGRPKQCDRKVLHAHEACIVPTVLTSDALIATAEAVSTLTLEDALIITLTTAVSTEPVVVALKKMADSASMASIVDVSALTGCFYGIYCGCLSLSSTAGVVDAKMNTAGAIGMALLLTLE